MYRGLVIFSITVAFLLFRSVDSFHFDKLFTRNIKYSFTYILIEANTCINKIC